MKYYIKATCVFKWARKLPRETVTYESAKCVPCNTRKYTHNGFVSEPLKWALKCRFYATGPSSSINSVRLHFRKREEKIQNNDNKFENRKAAKWAGKNEAPGRFGAKT